MKKALAIAIGFCGLASLAQAATAPIQRIDVVNLLAHSKANPGVTATPVTVKFYTSGSSAACTSATLPYAGGTSIFAGTGLACATAVTNIAVTALAGNANLIVYNDYASTALNPNGKFSSQIEILEGTAGGNAPVFNPNNGSLTTKGTIALTQQASPE